MRILLIEDDHAQGEFLYDALSKIGQTAWLTTEREFIEAWPQIAQMAPHVAVIDLMIRWDTPRLDAVQPPDGWLMFDAGVRCASRFLEISVTPPPFVIVYSVLEAPRLPQNAIFVYKDPDGRELIEIVRDLARDFPSSP
jgi:hypothetical protein